MDTAFHHYAWPRQQSGRTNRSVPGPYIAWLADVLNTSPFSRTTPRFKNTHSPVSLLAGIAWNERLTECWYRHLQVVQQTSVKVSALSSWLEGPIHCLEQTAWQPMSITPLMSCPNKISKNWYKTCFTELQTTYNIQVRMVCGYTPSCRNAIRTGGF